MREIALKCQEKGHDRAACLLFPVRRFDGSCDLDFPVGEVGIVVTESVAGIVKVHTILVISEDQLVEHDSQLLLRGRT